MWLGRGRLRGLGQLTGPGGEEQLGGGLGERGKGVGGTVAVNRLGPFPPAPLSRGGAGGSGVSVAMGSAPAGLPGGKGGSPRRGKAPGVPA